MFLFLETLRALYLGDNDFEFLPPEIGNLKNLQIVSYNFNLSCMYHRDNVIELYRHMKRNK